MGSSWERQVWPDMRASSVCQSIPFFKGRHGRGTLSKGVTGSIVESGSSDDPLFKMPQAPGTKNRIP